jgi:hypothetical protein
VMTLINQKVHQTTPQSTPYSTPIKIHQCTLIKVMVILID